MDDVEFIEQNYEKLIEAFLIENKHKWNDFCQDAWSEERGNYGIR